MRRQRMALMIMAISGVAALLASLAFVAQCVEGAEAFSHSLEHWYHPQEHVCSIPAQPSPI